MKLVTPLALLFAMPLAQATPPPANYEESAVPSYTLPPLATDGQELSTAHWEGSRRQQILEHFQSHVYGQMPPSAPIEATLVEEGHAFDGLAHRSQIKVQVGDHADSFFHILVYSPADPSSTAPAFLGLNFYGNQTVADDPAIILPTSWMRNNADFHITENIATEESRGVRESRWPVELIVSRGYAVASIYCGDIAPDNAALWRTRLGTAVLDPAASGDPGESETSAIGLWAWGLSRGLDALTELLPERIDPARVAVIGHSRLGKTALWAGATDPRFALTISNNSGCGGAALSRRRFGERLDHINTSFPHWFCAKLATFHGKEDDLPVDHHQLIALIAPRLAYVASATEDRWADPYGEFLAAREASPIWRAYGLEGIPANAPWPAAGEAVGDHVGYHLREGKHDINEWDWARYLDFADRH
jgi:hypothetical protein